MNFTSFAKEPTVRLLLCQSKKIWIVLKAHRGDSRAPKCKATGEPWCTPPHSGASGTTQKALDIISWNFLRRKALFSTY